MRSDGGCNPDDPQLFRGRFVRALLDWLILSLLSRSPAHGYGILRVLRRDFDADLSPGTLYPILYALEGRGLVRGRWEPPGGRGRKVYRMTALGWRFYRGGREHLRPLAEFLLRDGLPPPPEGPAS